MRNNRTGAVSQVNAFQFQQGDFSGFDIDIPADAFVQAVCELTESDLRPFFETWGLGISEDADAAIDALGHEPPDADLFAVLDEV